MSSTGALAGVRLAGPALDRDVAELVLQINLKPHRDLAIARVAQSMVQSTGHIFKLFDGRTFQMRNGETLRECTGSTDYNDRYFLYIGEQLGEEIAKQVDDYKLSAPAKYSTSMDAAWIVHNHACSWLFSSRLRYFKLLQRLARIEADQELTVAWPDVLIVLRHHMPAAICTAALQAVEISVGTRVDLL